MRAVSKKDARGETPASAKSGEKAAAGRARRHKSLLREYTEVAVTAILLALVIRSFVVQAFRIPSGSMEDTLLVGDFLLVNKFLYGARIPLTDIRLPAIREPRRGDVIVFRAHHVDKDFIKRCVGVGGDVVELRDNVLYVNGERVEEPYVKLQGPRPPVADWGPRRVPPGHFLMLGDNRNNSQDGRYFGWMDKKSLKGKAFIIYWSWNLSWDSIKAWFKDYHKIPPRPRFERIGDIIR